MGCDDVLMKGKPEFACGQMGLKGESGGKEWCEVCGDDIRLRQL